MNLRSLQKHLILISASTVFVIVLAGIIWLWQQASSSKAQIVAELDEQRTTLDGLHALKPAPSTENIDATKRDRTEIQQLYTRLMEGAAHASVTVTNLIRPIDFSQLLHDTVDHLSQKARPRVNLPANFLFGFSRYEAELPCRSLGGNAEECKKVLQSLGKEVLVIEKLGGLLMDSGIDEIVRIRRPEVDPGASSTDALDLPIVTDPKGLYTTYPFEVEFVCETRALRTFLNSLASADLFFVVRTVKVDSSTKTVTTGGTTPGRPGDAAAAGPTQTVDQRRITVVARVDFIEFNPAPAPAAPPARTPPPASDR